MNRSISPASVLSAPRFALAFAFALAFLPTVTSAQAVDPGVMYGLFGDTPTELTPYAAAKAKGRIPLAVLNNLTFTEAEMAEIYASNARLVPYEITTMPDRFLEHIDPDTLSDKELSRQLLAARYQARTVQLRQFLATRTPDFWTRAAAPVDAVTTYIPGAKLVRTAYTLSEGVDPVTGKAVSPTEVLVQEGLDRIKGKALPKVTRGMPGEKAVQVVIGKAVDPTIARTSKRVAAPKAAARPQGHQLHKRFVPSRT